jgi:hypothetical protein
MLGEIAFEKEDDPRVQGYYVKGFSYITGSKGTM